MNVEIAKELLRKGIALNDQELIAMANSLLDQAALVSYNVTTYEQQKKPSKKTEKKAASKTTENRKDASEFLMTNNNKANKKVPVNKVERSENKFFDDKTEFLDQSTPVVKLTPRDRPKPKYTTKSCESCGNKMKVIAGDQYASSYMCDNCIDNKRKGRR